MTSNEKLMEEWARRYADRIAKEREESKGSPETPGVKDGEDDGEAERNRRNVITPSGDAFFLEGDYGRAFLEEYNRIVEREYSGNSVLKVLNWDEAQSVVTGSNDYSVVLANKIFRDRGEKVRTATPADLAEILKTGKLELKGHYADAGLVLRTFSGVNEYLAGVLYGDIKQKSGKDIEMPFMINLSDLELRIDNNSPSKLAFVSLETVNPIHSDKFNHSNAQKKFNVTDKYGLPEFVKNGKRTWYTRNDGLAGFFLDRGLGLDSDGGLRSSDAGGRVVVVRCAGGASS